MDSMKTYLCLPVSEKEPLDIAIARWRIDGECSLDLEDSELMALRYQESGQREYQRS